MKRNAVVIVAVLVALGFMAWAGVANYQHRKDENAKLKQLQAMVAQPAQGSGSAQGATVAGEEEFSANPLQGQMAPNFTLKDTDGKKVSLSNYRGKAVVVDFWATWCAPCKIEIPWLEQFNTQYAGKGLQILGISEDDLDMQNEATLKKEKQEVAGNAAKMKINYPVLFDDADVSKPYGGVESLPTTFFIDRNGRVVASTVGLVSKDEIEANIKKALSSGGRS